MEGLAIDALLVSVLPEVWSSCGAETASFTVTFEVADLHVGGTFAAWVDVIGGERVTLAPVAAAGNTVELRFDLGTDALGCDGRCAVPVTIGLERLGVTEEHRIDLLVVNDGPPELESVFALAPDEELEYLDALQTEDSPPDSVSVADWPTLGFALKDGYATTGEAGQVFLAACPPAVDPATDATACAVLPATVDDEDWAHVVAKVATAPLGPLGCAAALAGNTIVLHALVQDHACGESLSLSLADGSPLFVDPDCDGDGVEPPKDCDDLDPSIAPGLVETWYDGVDTDCSGGSDLDQDGDGADALGYGGDDCDDTDPARVPGALEICDGKDNDCDGLLALGQATLTSATGAANFTSVQDALDAAAAGDTVAVCDGTYTGTFVVNVPIAFTSGSLDPSRTTLAADGPGQSVVRVGEQGDALDVTVAGFTITGAVGASDGGGIDGRGAATLTLQDLIVTDNDAARGGGLALAGDVVLTRVEVSDNTAVDGGGIVASSDAVLTFEDTTVSANSASVHGGGLFVVGSLTLDGTGTIEGNHADTDGGGLYAEGDGAALTLTGVTFSSNEAEASGGGIFARSTGATAIAVTLDDALLTANDAFTGGAVALSFATLETTDLDVDGNNAVLGGGIHLADGLSVLAGTDDQFDGNTAWDGGAVYLAGGQVDLTGGSLTANVADDDGGAIFVDGGATAFLRGAIVVDGNVAASLEQAAWLQSGLLVACDGTTVDDPVANSLGAFSPNACFELTEVDIALGECDGC